MKHIRHHAVAALLPAVAVIVLAAAPAAGQEPTAGPGSTEPTDTGPAAEPFPYQDELERDTPRGAMRGYLQAARDHRWQTAARYLDLSRLSADERARAEELARQLKRVLDRELWVELGDLSDRPAGHADDSLPPDVDRVGTIAIPDGAEVPVQLRRVRDGDQRLWKIGPETVARVDELYAAFGYGVVETLLPATFFDLAFLEIQLWQWLGLVVLVLVAWAVSWLAAWLILRVVVPLSRRTETTLDDELLGDGAPPLHFLLGLGAFALGLPALQLSVPAERFFYGVVQVLTVLSIIWLSFRLVDIVAKLIRGKLEAADNPGAVALLPLGRRTLKVVLGALGVLAVLQNLGVNVTALVAGLGVGGLAVALAAQKTLENLFGGITLAVDQPVRVGEFCRFGDKMGTVEDVGLRSTRVRTLDRTVVTVPNAEFSSLQIENFAPRDRMRLALPLGLRYETTAEQLRYVVVELRKLLLAHPMVLPDPARVRFVGFGASSLDVEIFAYVGTEDYNEFLAVREDLFLRMMDVVEASGSDFAFPSQTLYLGRDGGLDTERVSAAEAQVRAWREASELQMPHFREEVMAELDDTLDYPPEGSAVRVSRAKGTPGAEE